MAFSLRAYMGISLAFLIHGQMLLAQPSGGPYGPIQQSYTIPADDGTVYFVAPEADDESKGLSVDSPTSIESAIERAKTGDAIIVRGGVYRTGDLQFNQGITLQPYQDEQPIFKGTRIAANWERLRGDLWRTKWETLFPLAPQSWWRKDRNLRSTPVYMFNNDQVFVDGKPLATKGYPAELDERSYCVDYDEGYVYIGVNPANRTVEITAYDNALTRTIKDVHGKCSDKIGPSIRGIVFTQYAYRALEIEGYDPEGVSPEAEHGNDVVGTVIEHCTLSHCSRVGAYLRGNMMVIRHNLVSDTATEGLFILASNDVLLEKNIVTRNNEEDIRGYFATAVKIFNQCYRVTCNDNLIINNPNESSGIWYDVGNVDGVFINNWIQNTDNGFFFEISKGVICAGNVFVDCKTGTKVLNSSGAKLYQNTYVNSRAHFDRDKRGENDHFGWHPQSGPSVQERHGHEFGNNLMVAGPAFDMTLLQVQQRDVICDSVKNPMFAYTNHNVYVHGQAAGRPQSNDDQTSAPNLMSWAPVTMQTRGCTQEFKTLDDFQALKLGFEQSSLELSDYSGPLFQGKWLGNYAIDRSFATRTQIAPLPPYVEAVLSDAYQNVDFPGAFPPVN